MPSEKISTSTEKTDIPKRDFEDTVLDLIHLKTNISEKDYQEVITDITSVLQNWDSPASTDISESYPGWKKVDFKKLLRELGEKEPNLEKQTEKQKKKSEEFGFKQEHEQRVQREMVELQQSIINLQQRIQKHEPHRSIENPEIDLAVLEKFLHESKKLQSKLGWFARLRNTDRVKQVNAKVEEYTKLVTEKKAEVEKLTPEQRQANIQRQIDENRQKDEKEKQELREQLAILQNKLEKLMRS